MCVATQFYHSNQKERVNWNVSSKHAHKTQTSKTAEVSDSDFYGHTRAMVPVFL